MTYEDYLNEMDKATKKFEEEQDNESYHGHMDYIIVEFLKSLGYTEMADKYDEASEHFWYS